MLGVIFITVAYMNNKVENISENKKIEYRLVPRTIYDEQIENTNVSTVMSDIFADVDPIFN
tara:strand:- start:99 stop:281 length:183 start_codon:yes stop_codon:yes gene_type:complete